MDLDVIEVTGYRIQKKFDGFVATIEHDVLDFLRDSVKVTIEDAPETIFVEIVNTVMEKKTIDGKKWSFATYNMCKTGAVFAVTPELLKWVEDIETVIKEKQIRFTQVVL